MTHEDATRKLAECRQRIDGIDSDLRRLLNQRASVVEEILRMKDLLNLPIQEPRREEEVLRNAIAANPGPLTAEALKRIFERVMEEMRGLERALREHKQAGTQS
jgi:chorismate mutase